MWEMNGGFTNCGSSWVLEVDQLKQVSVLDPSHPITPAYIVDLLLTYVWPVTLVLWYRWLKHLAYFQFSARTLWPWFQICTE